MEWLQVHPVPAFSNLTLFDAALDKMQEVGLYLMYDMRMYVFLGP
jgi:hypothetical protein